MNKKDKKTIRLIFLLLMEISLSIENGNTNIKYLTEHLDTLDKLTID